MEELFERVKHLRKDVLHMTQPEFGAALGVSRDVVSNIEQGRLKKPEAQEPIYRLICEKFNVRMEWLKTGEGEIFCSPSRNDEIAAFVNRVLADRDESFKKRFITVLAFFSDDEWQLVEKIAEAIHNGVPTSELARTVTAPARTAADMTDEEIEAEVEAYRRDLIAEKKAGGSSSASDDSDESGIA